VGAVRPVTTLFVTIALLIAAVGLGYAFRQRGRKRRDLTETIARRTVEGRFREKEKR